MKLKRSRMIFTIGFGVSLALFTGILVKGSQTVYAQFATFGREFGYTYFSNEYAIACGTWNYNDVKTEPYGPDNFKGIVHDPNGTSHYDAETGRTYYSPTENTPVNADIFIEGFRRRLWSRFDHDRGRAAAIIAMFLGVQANDPRFDTTDGSPRWQKGVVWAQAHFDEWAKLVRDYETAGQVDFNTANIYEGSGVLDWMGRNLGNCNQYNNGPETYYEKVESTYLDRATIFYDADHNPLLVILLKCANLLGTVMPLKPPVPPVPPKAQCVNIPGAGTLAVGQSLVLQPSVRVTDYTIPTTGADRPKMTVWVKDPQGIVQQRTLEGNDVKINGSTVSVDYMLNAAKGGVYEVQWRADFAGTDFDITCPSSAQVYKGSPSMTGDPYDPRRNPGEGEKWRVNAGYQPYFSTRGGDIAAGMAGNPTLANILGYNGNGGTYGYAGGSSQLAALATGNISNYITATGLGGVANDTRASALAFSNEGSTRGGSVNDKRYGGQFEAMPDTLLPNYNDGAVNRSDTSINVGNMASGVYRFNNDVTLSGTLNPNQNITIYITGGHHAFINGNITYNYGNLNEIPRLNLVVDAGNIYIGTGVSEVHGVLIARNQASGRIYTCATGMATPVTMTNANAYDICNNKLTVYGAVVATKLHLDRTTGHWLTAGAPAAEEFVYSPEVWLSRPDGGVPGTGANTYKFDSYISLPPTL
jgi:hypothetical protein